MSRRRCTYCPKAASPGRYECPEHDDGEPYGQPTDRDPLTPGGLFGDLRCPACRRIPQRDERHELLAGVHGPEDSPEPEYVCLGVDDEPLDSPAVGSDEPAPY